MRYDVGWEEGWIKCVPAEGLYHRDGLRTARLGTFLSLTELSYMM